MTKVNRVPLSRPTLSLAVCSALAAMAASSASADPLLTVKLFRDSDVMFRDSDMSRYADNYVELGAGYNSNDSFRFGQFSGLTEKGAFAIAGFNWQERHEGNYARYWRIYGANLGLDSRKFLLEAGEQGGWDVSFGVDQLKRSEIDTARFYHAGLGTNALTLAGGCGTVANVAAINTGCLKEYDIQQGRDIYRIGLNRSISREWGVAVSYREDKRDGTRLTGVAMNTTGGLGTALNVPYAINDRTQQLEASLAHSGDKLQWQLAYSLSRFRNDDTAFEVTSPFSTGAVLGRMSLNPDNNFHQIQTTAAYSVARQTRITAQLMYGVATQSEAFLPYTTDPGVLNRAMPRSSLDGKVVHSQADIALMTQPLDLMNLKLAYQYRNNDNRTPVAEYLYAGRDGAQPSTPLATTSLGFVRTNVPMSTTESRYTADADYRVTDRTVLRGIAERKHSEYTMADRSETDTDKFSLELRRPVSDEFLGSAGYIYTQRRGSIYDSNIYYRKSYTDPTLPTQPRYLTNHPSLRRFMWGSYNEDRVRTSGNWTASETINFQATADRFQQRHHMKDCDVVVDANLDNRITPALPDTCLGVTRAQGGSVNLDVQWQPDENLTAFAFGNYSVTATQQRGRAWNRDSGNGAPDESDSATLTQRDWFGTITYRDHAFGTGIKWQLQEKWDFGGTYVYSRGRGSSDLRQITSPAYGSAGAITAATAVPDTLSRLHSLQLFAKWDYSKAVSWRFNYVYEMLRSSDWAYDGVAATASNEVLLTGQTSANYINHVIGVSVALKSW